MYELIQYFNINKLVDKLQFFLSIISVCYKTIKEHFKEQLMQEYLASFCKIVK